MKQPIPQVSEVDVARVVRRDFAAEDVQLVEASLSEYVGANPHRVRLAILKLAAGDLELLGGCINLARADFRDVLGAAEYWAYSKLPQDASESAKNVAIEQDWAAYQDWLGRR